MNQGVKMAMPKEALHLVDGRWIGTPECERRNPAQPDEVVVRSARGTAADVQEAVAAAKAAQPGWAATPAPGRGAILDKASRILASRIPEVAEDLVREEGKTLPEATTEVQRAVSVLRFFAGEGQRLSGETIPASSERTLLFTRREPIGIGAVITPWNFPIAIPAWKLGPALVSGNSVILKPAELTPLSANHLASALLEAGLPAGVLNVIHGQGSVVGSALVEDPRATAVSFTGSTEVGAAINARVATRMGRVQLEMGGKNAIIVTDDADIEAAAAIVARSAFGLTGQACTAASRVIVSSAVGEQLAMALTDQIHESFQPGNGLAGGQIGPLVSAEQAASVRDYVQAAVADGAELVTGAPNRDDLLFAPTVLHGVRSGDRIAQEEVFGPVLAMIDADDFAAALQVADDVRYGLTAGICTRDLTKAHLFAERVQAGVVKVNQPTVGLELQVPFGGVKASSTGTYREQGTVATDFWTWSKSVYMSY